jgi:tripartite-type tricarboxylate transporter receptor subunit TctC
MRASQAAMGAEPVFEEPAAVTARLRADIVKWGEVIKAADIKPE